MDEEQATSLLLLAEDAESELKGHAAADCLARLESEHSNFRAALRWLLEHGEAEKGLRLATALYSFWHTRGYAQEAREWFAAFLALPDASSSTRAKALHRAGMLAFRQGDQAATHTLFEESLATARQAGDKRQVAATLLGLGRQLGLRQGDYAAGHRLFEESLAIAREQGDRQGVGMAIHCLAALARLEGNHARAVALYEESLALHRDLGDQRSVAMEQLNLGFMTYSRGDVRRAARLFVESLRTAQERGDNYLVPPDLLGLAGVALKSGEAKRAARILGAVDAVLANAGIVLDPDDRIEYNRIAEAVRSALDGEAMKTAWTEGHAMTLGQAIGYALEQEPRMQT
jgi:non-specific serine/threonine protein kinase